MFFYQIYRNRNKGIGTGTGTGKKPTQTGKDGK